VSAAVGWARWGRQHEIDSNEASNSLNVGRALRQPHSAFALSRQSRPRLHRITRLRSLRTAPAFGWEIPRREGKTDRDNAEDSKTGDDTVLQRSQTAKTLPDRRHRPELSPKHPSHSEPKGHHGDLPDNHLGVNPRVQSIEMAIPQHEDCQINEEGHAVCRPEMVQMQDQDRRFPSLVWLMQRRPFPIAIGLARFRKRSPSWTKYLSVFDQDLAGALCARVSEPVVTAAAASFGPFVDAAWPWSWRRPLVGWMGWSPRVMRADQGLRQWREPGHPDATTTWGAFGLRTLDQGGRHREGA
jgi:hypothetical protein